MTDDICTGGPGCPVLGHEMEPLPPNTCPHCRGKGTLPGNNAPVQGFSPPNCWHCNGQGAVPPPATCPGCRSCMVAGVRHAGVLERAADAVEGYDTDERQRGWREGLLHAASIVRDGKPHHRRSLFTWGAFTAASGRTLGWKIDCDFLTPEDWRTLALIAEPLIPPVREIFSVPSGGDEFARAMRATGVVSNEPGRERLPRLVVDDVWTTGGSVTKVYHPGDFVLVAFARGPIPAYVTAIWQLEEAFGDADPLVLDDGCIGTHSPGYRGCELPDLDAPGLPWRAIDE